MRVSAMMEMAESRNVYNADTDKETSKDVTGDVTRREKDDVTVEGDVFDGDDVFTDIPFEQLMSHNQFTVRKMAAHAMMDVALMMANISQLRTLMSSGADRVAYFALLVSLVVISLVSQLVFGVLIFVIWVRESSANRREAFKKSLHKREFQSAATGSAQDAVLRLRLSIRRMQEHFRSDVITDRLNHVTMVLVFIITVINMFITGFGIETPGDCAGVTNSTPP